MSSILTEYSSNLFQLKLAWFSKYLSCGQGRHSVAHNEASNSSAVKKDCENWRENKTKQDRSSKRGNRYKLTVSYVQINCNLILMNFPSCLSWFFPPRTEHQRQRCEVNEGICFLMLSSRTFVTSKAMRAQADLICSWSMQR